jgi:hypothetical protein
VYETKAKIKGLRLTPYLPGPGEDEDKGQEGDEEEERPEVESEASARRIRGKPGSVLAPGGSLLDDLIRSEKVLLLPHSDGWPQFAAAL